MGTFVMMIDCKFIAERDGERIGQYLTGTSQNGNMGQSPT